MTDKELIAALRCCNAMYGECSNCPREQYGEELMECVAHLNNEATDRMEALIAENEILEAQCEAHCETEMKLAKKIRKERRNRQKLTIEKMQLKAEYDHLRKVINVPTKWASVDELLPESADHSVLAVVSGVCENTNGGCVIAFHDAIEIATYYRDDEQWFVEAYPYWENPNVTYWQPLPEPPSTEGVEG